MRHKHLSLAPCSGVYRRIKSSGRVLVINPFSNDVSKSEREAKASDVKLSCRGFLPNACYVILCKRFEFISGLRFKSYFIGKALRTI